MAAAIRLGDDFDAATLRRLAKASRGPDQLHRLLSLAEIYDGGSRDDAARIGGIGLSARLGASLQRARSGGPDRPERPGQSPEAERGAAPSAGSGVRERSDPGDPWCRALAPDGLGALGLGGIPHPKPLLKAEVPIFRS